MGFKLMSAVFESASLGPTERLVMLALADHADEDTGRCYPSIARICQRTGLGERTVQGAIRKLRASGHLTIIPGGGRGNANLYVVNPAAETPFISANPAVAAPITAQPEGETPQILRETPQITALNPAAAAPEPLRTTINQQQSREAEAAAALSKTARETILEAIGVDPVSGITGPDGRMIGTAVDMATAATWSDMGLTLEQQVAVIREVCARARRKSPGWQPRGFGYFTDAMGDVRKARQSKPTVSADSDRDRKRAFWRRVSGAAA